MRIRPLWVLMLAFAGLQAQEALIQNVGGRTISRLNGLWNIIVDPYENGFYDYRYTPFDTYSDPSKSGGYFANKKPVNPWDRIEYDFDLSEHLKVPGDWNHQQDKLYYYEGTVWYKRGFDHIRSNHSNRVFIHFGAVNYKADVYLNGHKLGSHRGGFTPFNFEITHLLKDRENFLVLKVDNTRRQEEVPTVNTDWWNFGGITRDVQLIEVPATFIEDYYLQLEKGSDSVLKGYVQLNGAEASDQSVQIRIPELRIEKVLRTDTQGRAEIDLRARRIRLWSPEDPKLYEVEIQLGEALIRDRIGFRTLATKGPEILLNGEPIFLRGICLHEENPLRGARAFSMEEARMMLGWAREMGCNYVRLAHYPHNENMVRLADEMGIMVWEENPVYWTISWDNEYTYKTAEQQLREVISRDKNRASVIIWSMANETPVSPARMNFLTKLREVALSLDDTRLISAALEVHGEGPEGLTRKIPDPFAELVDVLSFNAYVGWYDGLPEKCERIDWAIQQNKPVIVSEFGAGALQGLHGGTLDRWTEEYQEHLYEESLDMFLRLPQLRGLSPWILSDFHSPRRVLPGIQDGWNRKGLIGHTGQRKKAFFTMQRFYQEMEITWGKR